MKLLFAAILVFSAGISAQAQETPSLTDEQKSALLEGLDKLFKENGLEKYAIKEIVLEPAPAQPAGISVGVGVSIGCPEIGDIKLC